MSAPIAFRAAAARPCPVCGSPSKGCSATDDGLHLCRGEARGGWRRITRDADAAGFHHYRREDDRPHNGSGKPAPPPPARDWRAEAARYARALTGEHRAQLASALGLPPDAPGALPLLGFVDDPHHGPCWTFAEVDAAGSVTAICRRVMAPRAGQPDKPVMQGGRRGVYAAAGWRERPGPVLVPEGASDVMALTLAGLAAVGRPNDKGGAETVAEMLRGTGREVIVVGENDRKADGRWPGREGAECVAAKLAELLGRPVRWALPPEGAKDSRAWICGLLKRAAALPEIGREVLAHLHAKAVVVGPNRALSAADDDVGELSCSSVEAIMPEAVHFLVPDVIPAGMMGMLAGEGGHGKSMTTLELTAALSVGRCAFGLKYDNPAAGKTLLISCEDDWQRTIIPRLAALGADRSKILRVEGIRTKNGGRLLDFHMGHFRELERALHADPTIKLVVIDPAGAYVGRAGVNENHDAELRALLGPLSEAANRTGATVLLIKHLNKSAGVSAVQRVGGSVGYVNAVRFSYMIAPDPDDADLKLMVPIKANVLPSRTAGLTFRMEPLEEAEASALLLREWPAMKPDDAAALAKQLFRQAWQGGVEVDADAVAGRKQSRAESGEDVQRCVEFIRAFLGGFAWPDDELEAAVHGAKFSFATLKKAKAKMRGTSKTDPQRLSSKPLGEGGAWWQWVGSQYDRPPNRPDPSPSLSQERETGETGETERLARLKTEGRSGGPPKQSIQSSSSTSFPGVYPPAANEKDCPPPGAEGVL